MRSQPARVAIDLETTGLHPEQDAIIEIGAVKFAGDDELETFEALVAPGIALPYRIQRLTGITPIKLRGAAPLAAVLPRLRAFLGDLPLVGHNIPFDVAFLRRVGLAWRNPQVDTYELASALLPGLRSYTLGAVAEALGVPSETHHRALADAQLSRHVAVALLLRLEALDTGILEQLDALPAPNDWTLRYFLRQHLRDRQPAPSAARGNAFAGHLTSSLGELLASKMAVNPDVLSLAVATEPEVTTEVDATEQVAMAAAGASTVAAPANPALDAGVSACLRDGGVLLVEATADAAHLAALAGAAVRWAADATGHLLIVVPDGAAMRRMALEVLPAERVRMGISAEQVPVAMLAEAEAYLCLHRWYGMARVSLDGPFSRELTRGLAKMVGWTRQTRTGLRVDIALPGQEAQAWEQARAGDEFAETKADCPYRQDGYCFAARAEQAAHAARVIVTTHAALAARAVGMDSALPQAERVIVLDAGLLDEALRRAASATLDSEALDTLLGRLARQEPGGQRVGLLHVAAGRMAAGAGQQRERGWFEQISRTRQVAERFFSALRGALEASAGHGSQRGGDSGVTSEGGEPRFLRLDAEVRRYASWGMVTTAWQGLEQHVMATAKLARETVKALRAAEGGKKSTAADGLAVELLAAARTLEALAREGASMVLAEERENEVRWLRVPYPNTPDGGGGDGGQRRFPPRDHKGGKPGARNGRDGTEADTAGSARNASEAAAPQPEPSRLPVLHRAPVSVGPLLAPFSADGRGLVLSGPALAVAGDFDYLRGTLGLPEHAPALAIAPDCEEQTLLCLPNDVSEPNAQHYQRHLETMLMGLAKSLGGRMVVLFPSHAALRATYQGIRRNLEREDVLVLAQGQDGSARQLWHTFDTQPRTVLLGAGGFWHGHEQGTRPPACVVVTRLPFPALSDPLLAARAELWEDQQSQFVVPQAALKVRRALNGLVWSHHERNAVVLFDRRIQSRGYGQTVLATLPRCTQREGTAKELTERITDWVDLIPQ